MIDKKTKPSARVVTQGVCVGMSTCFVVHPQICGTIRIHGRPLTELTEEAPPRHESESDADKVFRFRQPVETSPWCGEKDQHRVRDVNTDCIDCNFPCNAFSVTPKLSESV